MFLPNVDKNTITQMLELADLFPENCYPMIGLHPTSVKTDYLSELKIVEEWLSKRKFYAIGETGIDLYWDKKYIREQIDAFNKQIIMSLDNQLPVIIHSRNSFNEIFSVLEKFNNSNLKGIFHSYTGSYDQALKAIDMGFKIGIGGIVSFKNAGVDNVVKKIDLEHIVLETDSPYLAPVPNRGKRNESSYLLFTAAKIAEIHNTDINMVAEITTANAKKVFNI
jgi:TatD DNase family protein